MGYGTMLIPHDVIRREILRVADEANNPSIDLASMLAVYGKKIGYNVIIEGIFPKEKYGVMLKDLIDAFEGNAYVYYFDISFKETVRRHQTKATSTEYGEKEMRDWWQEKDHLGIPGERIILETMSEEEIVDTIYEAVS